MTNSTDFTIFQLGVEEAFLPTGPDAPPDKLYRLKVTFAPKENSLDTGYHQIVDYNALKMVFVTFKSGCSLAEFTKGLRNLANQLDYAGIDTTAGDAE